MFSNWKIEVFLVTQSVSESIMRPQYLYQIQLKDVKNMLWSCFLSLLLFIVKSYEEKCQSRKLIVFNQISLQKVFRFMWSPSEPWIYLRIEWKINISVFCIHWKWYFDAGKYCILVENMIWRLAQNRRRGRQNFEKNETARQYKLMIWRLGWCDSDWCWLILTQKLLISRKALIIAT